MNEHTAAILVVEDETTLARNISVYLGRYGYVVRIAESAEAALATLADFQPDLILLDCHLPGRWGLDAMPDLLSRARGCRVVVMTGHGTVKLAVDAMKAGAADFLTKPVALSQLRGVIEQSLARERDGRLDEISHDVGLARRAPPEVEGLVGESAPMIELRSRLARLREADATLAGTRLPSVLITGETGTGKELVARAIHGDGPRAAGPFVEINCAAIPSSLLESELFGYERGAFTDARERKIGLVEAASGGTLFLDEIGETEPALQAKILKLIEEHSVRRLGGLRAMPVDLRVVAATHQPLDQRVAEGRFRADLLYRLRVFEIPVAPLRERGDDIERLARHFLHELGERYRKPSLTLDTEAIAAIQSHGWPGNVRELRNRVEQAVLLSVGARVGASDLGLSVHAPAEASLAARSTATDETHAAPPGSRAAPSDLRALANAERAMLQRALDETGGNVSRAARRLGVSRDTLRYRIEKFGLVVPR
ncbi:MAG: sigma-54-dependent Fis family transcriptional regulator [Burkholderiaceae bacterium]|nr:sigma-54-dependent Fis family transcriptional regulator [Burkholderiaceae bacterium]